MTDIRPVGNIVIIELVKRARESKSGIITTVEEEYMDYGVVYKIGSLVREPEYATGDKVLFDTKGATRYNLPDKEVMVVDSRVIQCVLVE